MQSGFISSCWLRNGLLQVVLVTSYHPQKSRKTSLISLIRFTFNWESHIQPLFRKQKTMSIHIKMVYKQLDLRFFLWFLEPWMKWVLICTFVAKSRPVVNIVLFDLFCLSLYNQWMNLCIPLSVNRYLCFSLFLLKMLLVCA